PAARPARLPAPVGAAGCRGAGLRSGRVRGPPPARVPGRHRRRDRSDPRLPGRPLAGRDPGGDLRRAAPWPGARAGPARGPAPFRPDGGALQRLVAVAPPAPLLSTLLGNVPGAFLDLVGVGA